MTFQIIVPILAGASALAYAKSETLTSPAHRLAWRLFGWAGFAFGLGQVVRLFYRYGRRVAAPLPSQRRPRD